MVISNTEKKKCTHEMRVLIHENVYYKFKSICAENKLSVPKVTAQLIKQFIEIDESNKKMTSHLRK